jgi:hypothetical protein
LKLFAFTIDLEAEHAGIVDQYEIFKDHTRIEDFLSAIQSTGVKITAFTVGEIFELFPDVIRIFKKYDCEFEAHSYSHDIKGPDSEEEIQKARSAFFNYFGKYPIGYRAPQGRISKSGIKALEKHGFLYDSSIFPSYYPNPFKYLFSNRKVHFHSGSKIMEIPLTSITPFRLTLNIAYIKLFGLNFIMELCKLFTLPDVICFNSHLHDFIHEEASYNKLPSFWKFIFARNKYQGIDFCVKFLEFIKQQGYRFCYMSELYELNKK